MLIATPSHRRTDSVPYSAGVSAAVYSGRRIKVKTRGSVVPAANTAVASAGRLRGGALDSAKALTAVGRPSAGVDFGDRKPTEVRRTHRLPIERCLLG